jgi:hypothetical protein
MPPGERAVGGRVRARQARDGDSFERHSRARPRRPRFHRRRAVAVHLTPPGGGV